MASDRRVLIAGTGIGGLTAALALKQRGFDVHVFEKVTELRAIGAGISLQMNAMAALNSLGLLESIRDAGNQIRHARILAGDASEIGTVPFWRISEAIGFPFVAIHRGRLQSLLLDALGHEHVTTGVEVDQIVLEGERVRVRLPDGGYEVGDLLVGADGIHSQVRKHLWGDQAKRYTGYSAWRGVCPSPHITPVDEFVEVWGDRQVFGHLHVNADEMYWFGTRLMPTSDLPQGDPRPSILEQFGNLPAARELIEGTPPENLVFSQIYDRPPLDHWGQGAITLLGDAAHPMTPNMGQGGCQAVEDAIILARELATGKQIETCLRKYETLRRPRANHFVKQSRFFTSLAHGHPAWARLARATVFRWMPEAIKVRQMRKLYRFDPNG